MKPKKNILIIDDEDQTKIVESLQLNLKKNFDVNFILIKTNDVAFQNDDADLDIIKIKERISNDIQSVTVDLALTDYDLGDEHVDGLNIIEILKEIRPNVRVILYSGNQDKVIRKIVGNNPNTEDLVAGFKKLLNFGIIDFVRRPDYRDRIIKYLNSNKKIHLDSYFLIQLRKYKDYEFKSCCPGLKGMKLGEIADMIEKGSDFRSREWMQELIEQSIAYLIKINE